MDPVVQISPEMARLSHQERMNWRPWFSTVIEPTRVWPWTTTQKDLSTSLAGLLKTYSFALCSPIGLREYAAEFAETIPTYLLSGSRTPKASELINWIDEWTTKPGRGPRDSITVGQHRYTVKELELVRATLPELPLNADDSISELWPGPDKQWPEGRTGGWWYERYTGIQLLKRTNAIFDGALRIYNDIVETWFPAFNKRNQMNYMLPLRFEGVLNLRNSPDRRDLNDATLVWWPRIANSYAESGVFFELKSDDESVSADTREKLQEARDDFILHRGTFHHSIQILPGNGPRPATELAHKWLTDDLRNLGWL